MKTCIVIAVAIALFAGCTKKKGKKESEIKLAFSSNMECVDCWSNVGTLKQGIAHSGTYASKLDSANEYSYAFVQTFKNIKPNQVKKVNVKVWGYFPNADIRAQLVIAIDSASKSKFWEGMKLEDKIKTANTWTEVTFSVLLPATCSDNDVFKVYVWNPSKRTFFIDDLEVTFE